MNLANVNKYSDVPDELLTVFYDMLHEQTMTTEKQYVIDPVSGEKVLNRIKTISHDYAIKDIIAVFQLLFPQYFDQLQFQKVKKIKALDTSSTDKELAEKIKDALA